MKSKNYLAALAVLALITAQFAFGTALDDYVAAPDASYRYSLVNTVKGKGFTSYVLDMTSQSWRSKKEVNKTAWQHWLTIIKPDKAGGNKALLLITGGANFGSAPQKTDPMLVKIALATNTPVAELRMVPNQPLKFPDSGFRFEDAIIAYTLDKCLNTGDETWPLLLPMVKSAVRAMDTIQSHLKSESEGKLNIKKFVVCGASKRGWTTWLTAAVDKRVIAIMPLVIDVLNMDESMKHHFSAYGFYSPVIQDYVKMGVFERMDTPVGQALLKVVDPYEYRDRLTMPKYLMNSTGDQFFLPDSAQFYFHDLKGEKYLRYVPNTGHGLNDSDASESLLAFYMSILTNSTRPKFSWQVKDNRIIVKNTSDTLIKVNLWQATNEKTRDFRIGTIGRVWKSSTLTEKAKGTYVAKVEEPKEGWTAFFVELIYDSGGEIPYKFTTQVHVVPQRLPFADKLSSDSDVDLEKLTRQEIFAASP